MPHFIADVGLLVLWVKMINADNLPLYIVPGKIVTDEGVEFDVCK